MPFLMKAWSYVLIVTMTLMPTQGIVQASADVNTQDFISQAGKEGQQFGLELGNEANNTPAKVQQGSISVPTRGENGQLQYEGGDQFSVQSLYPGSNPSNAALKKEYFPDGIAIDVNHLKSIHDSDSGMGETGSDAKDSLWADAHSEQPSVEGAAYKVLLDSSNLSKPDFRQDPMLGLTQHVYEHIDLIAAGFSDCKTATTFDDVAMYVHNPEYETCDRITDKSADCQVLHHYQASVIEHHNGPYNIAPCEGSNGGCSDIWIGKVGDNYWSGYCSVYEEYTEIKVANPAAITSATLIHAKWDDYMQIWVGKPGQEVKIWSGPNANFPPETPGACELNTSWDTNPNLDLTPYFKNIPANSVVRFTIRVSVAGAGEGFGKVRIQYDPSQSIVKDSWSPKSCIESATGLFDGFAKGNIQCIEDPRGPDGCVFTNGIRVCPNNLKPSPFPGVSNLCKKVSVKANYDFYLGQMDCYQDINGNRRCPVNRGGHLNSCQEFENNPQCGFISSNCVEGAQGASSVCYVKEETWDCGSGTSINTLEKNTQYQCEGAIRCMGSDCLDPNQSQNQTGNFAKASALLNAAQFMTQDMTCTGQDDEGHFTGTENVTCTAFGGKPGECKIAVGGVANCCEKPSNVSMADYLLMIRQIPKIDAAVMSLKSDSAVKSAYQTLREPAMSTWSEVKKPFTNYIDNISGTIDEFTNTMDEVKKQLIDELKAQVKKLYHEIMGSAAEDAVADAAATAAADQAADEAVNSATTEASSQLMTQATSMLGTAMSIYSAYVATIAIIQLVYACEKDEYVMNAQRATNNCTYIGSYCKQKTPFSCIEKRKAYCCFNSPLSRIIQEQVRPQFGQSFGPATNPSCEGIPLDKIAEVDWDRVNFDEWLAILQQNGQFPNGKEITMDSLTGSGNVFNTKGDRLPADQRAMKRVEGIDIDSKRFQAMEQIEIHPGGAVERPSQ